jgi:hypothetical protein
MTTTPNPLPSARSRRPFRVGWQWEISCSLASSELGSPTAVAKRGCWAGDHTQ